MCNKVVISLLGIDLTLLHLVQLQQQMVFIRCLYMANLFVYYRGQGVIRGIRGSKRTLSLLNMILGIDSPF